MFLSVFWSAKKLLDLDRVHFPSSNVVHVEVYQVKGSRNSLFLFALFYFVPCLFSAQTFGKAYQFNVQEISAKRYCDYYNAWPGGWFRISDKGKENVIWRWQQSSANHLLNLRRNFLRKYSCGYYKQDQNKITYSLFCVNLFGIG